MKPEMKKLIIANLPYLLFVYLFGKLGQTYRLAAGADLSEKLLHLADGFSLAFESAAPSFHLFDLAVGVAGAVALRLMVYCKSKNAKKYRRGVEYGSARWGSPKDIVAVGILIDGKRRQEREEEEYQAKLQEYENNLGQYQLRLSEIESENQKKRDMYEKQLVAYSEEVADYESRGKAVMHELFDAKWNLEEALISLYEEGIIYSKYRNLVAVSTIYEYLASGRCDQLEGPNGAYNLYEMELRQNIVIGQLSTITEHLEQIKENQYTLYYEIQNANRNSESMLSSIGDDVKFSAYQNAATAKNVETMRYISMMKNVWNGKGF